MQEKNRETAEQKLQEREQLCLLFDFYGPLLKEHARQMFEDYMFNDYSLSEIADASGITRQGVHDALKRSSRQLMAYEEKLGLAHRFEKQQDLLQKVRQQLLTLSQTQEKLEKSVTSQNPIGMTDWQLLLKEFDELE